MLSLTYSIQEGFATRSRADRPRIGGAEDQPAEQLSEQVRAAYEYVAALTRDEAELKTVLQQALELVGQRRAPPQEVVVGP